MCFIDTLLSYWICWPASGTTYDRKAHQDRLAEIEKQHACLSADNRTLHLELRDISQKYNQAKSQIEPAKAEAAESNLKRQMQERLVERLEVSTDRPRSASDALSIQASHAKFWAEYTFW